MFLPSIFYPILNEGWQEQSRRLVIYASDAPFHIAGDGKVECNADIIILFGEMF
jgi:hypothetical protein